jgi:hypothetical protein
MRARWAVRRVLPIIAAMALVAGVGIPSFAAGSGFDPEQPAGTPLLHQSNWEPTVATDPSNANRVYQLITGINAHECAPRCPGTSVLFRRSTDGGASWGPQTFVCGLACEGVGWQFDPQIKVATNGTIYVAFMNTYDPGVVLFTSTDRGNSWSGPVTMNGSLTYMDKPILVISPTGHDVYVSFNGKHSSYVVASHDGGQTFLPPTKTDTDTLDLWWYSDGGTVAPDGTVFFSENGESGSASGGHQDGPNDISVLRCTPDPAVSCKLPTWHSFGTSAAPPPCPVFGCYPDYFAPTPSIAADASGRLVAAYTFSTVANGPKTLYARTSTDGGSTWSARTLINSKGDSNVPQIAAGPTAGDFRLAWQDDRTGAFNTWYTATSNGGSTWSKQVKLSNLTSGAPYKTAAGYTFTDGDYFGLAVGPTGVTYAIWGEADGSSIYCCGDVWYTKGS